MVGNRVSHHSLQCDNRQGVRNDGGATGRCLCLQRIAGASHASAKAPEKKTETLDKKTWLVVPYVSDLSAASALPPRETWRCFACVWRALATATKVASGTELASASCPTRAACAAREERGAAYTSARRCATASCLIRGRLGSAAGAGCLSATCGKVALHVAEERVGQGCRTCCGKGRTATSRGTTVLQEPSNQRKRIPDAYTNVRTCSQSTPIGCLPQPASFRRVHLRYVGFSCSTSLAWCCAHPSRPM